MPTDGVADWNVQQTGRNVKTVQTHNAVNVTGSTVSNGAWVDTSGFDQIAFTFKNDAATSSGVSIGWSNDNVNRTGKDQDIGGISTTQEKVGIVATKARYARLELNNADVAAHTISAWVYLKA